MVVGAILSGAGDACLHTEMYDNLGAMYPNDSASAFAVFKFIRVSWARNESRMDQDHSKGNFHAFLALLQSAASAVSFYYGKFLGLYSQLVILLVLNVMSWILYHYVQWFMMTTSSSVVEIQPEQVNDNSTKEKCPELEMEHK